MRSAKHILLCFGVFCYYSFPSIGKASPGVHSLREEARRRYQNQRAALNKVVFHHLAMNEHRKTWVQWSRKETAREGHDTDISVCKRCRGGNPSLPMRDGSGGLQFRPTSPQNSVRSRAGCQPRRWRLLHRDYQEKVGQVSVSQHLRATSPGTEMASPKPLSVTETSHDYHDSPLQFQKVSSSCPKSQTCIWF